MTRDENGRFVKGGTGGPGRPKKEREERYYEILSTACTYDKWREIVEKAISQAIRGNAVARKFLADYLIGPPIQKLEHTGAEGGPLCVVVTGPNGEGDGL